MSGFGIVLLAMSFLDDPKGVVVYDSDLELRCVISVSDSYWRWRKGISVNTSIDVAIRNIQKQIEVNFKSLAANENLDSREVLSMAMCRHDLLLGMDLTYVLSRIGEDVSPGTFYHAFFLELARGNDSRIPCLLTNEDVFRTMVVEIVKERQRRFDDEVD